MRPAFPRKLAAALVVGCLTAAASAQVYPPMGCQQPYGGNPPAYNPYYAYAPNPYYGYIAPATPTNYYQPPAASAQMYPPMICQQPYGGYPPAYNNSYAYAPNPYYGCITPAAPINYCQPPAPAAPAASTDCGTWVPDCIQTPCCERIWVSAEFLMWWTNKIPVTTPLWTEATNPFTVFQPNGSGSLGSPDTIVLLGGQSYELNQPRFGGRFTLGAWLDCDCQLGIEGNYLFIARNTTTLSSMTDGSPGSPILGFPFKNAATGQEDFIDVAVPGFSGGATLTLSNRLQGGELNALFQGYRGENLSITGLAGFRYLNFEENLDFTQGDAGVPGTGLDGIFRTSTDHFDASNNFYGANLGLRGEYRLGNLFVNATGKCALGVVQQYVRISGSTLFINPGSTVAYSAGTFALPTNIGNHFRNDFAVLPEANFNLGYDITRNIRVFVGYTFLYINDVARPGANIDHNINPTISPALVPGTTLGPLVGAAVPAFPFNHSDFWAQGINFGVTMRW
jgi:hypothetical protein